MHIDVIIPTFNREKTITRAVDSVLNQSYPHFFIHVVDDGSTDKTLEILKEYQDSRLKIHTQSNKGVSAARNLGAQNATIYCIIFLDSDDFWLPHKLKTQSQYLTEHPECYFLHSEEIWIRNGVRVNPKKKHQKSNNDIFNRSLEFCLISPSTTILKTEIFNLHQGFDEELVVCEDYDLWLKVLLNAKEENLGFISDPLIEKYGGHEDQLSTKYVAMDYWRLKSLLNLYNQSSATENQKMMIKETALKKSELLIKNYEKYQNLDKITEIKELLNQNF